MDRMREEAEVARPGRRPLAIAGLDTSGLDESAMEDYRAAFGTGEEYDWALELQDEAEKDQFLKDKELNMRDVFEDTQLRMRMLTTDDIQVLTDDAPERMQMARKGLRIPELSGPEADAYYNDQATWISNLLLPKKNLAAPFTEPFHNAVVHVIRLFNEQNLEVPFIFQNRKDYIVHEYVDEDGKKRGNRLLAQTELWDVFELDLKYKLLVEKRQGVQRLYDNLKRDHSIQDASVEELLPIAVTLEEVQDIHDYLSFQYSAQIKDSAATSTNGTHKKSRAFAEDWEKIRASKPYHFVRAIGLSADSFAQNALGNSVRNYTDDTADRPEDLADSLIESPWFTTSAHVIGAGKALYCEEMAQSPRMRKYIRKLMYENGVFDCIRTAKGAVQITEEHRYYEFKYLRSQEFSSIARKPEMFLRMLKAEEEGLIQVKLRMLNGNSIRQRMYSFIESDSFSDVADTWNVLRRELIDTAYGKLERQIARGVKEALRSECEDSLARHCRDMYAKRLDQGPYKPPGMSFGTTPRVITLSNGNGVPGRDAVVFIVMEEDGRVVETGKYVDLKLGNPDKLIPSGKDVAAFVDLVQRHKPDVIGISGFSIETRRLYKDIQELVDKNDLRTAENDDDDHDRDDHEDENGDSGSKIKVVMVNDEVARLYHNSERANAEFPTLPPLARYCIALARYLRGPLYEYAALHNRDDITSISFDRNQDLIPESKLRRYLEMAIVDLVNLVGLDLEEAIEDSYTANLLPFVCGLGPRKAAKMLKTIAANV
jgi:transcription elongation factor SPT6